MKKKKIKKLLKTECKLLLKTMANSTHTTFIACPLDDARDIGLPSQLCSHVMFEEKLFLVPYETDWLVKKSPRSL